MILSPIYREKFDRLQQKFGCSEEELEILLRESRKNSNNRLASIESLIDQQLSEVDAPRIRRIYAVDRSVDEPIYRRGRKPKQEESGRLSSREIREIFEDIHPRDIFFMRNFSPKNFRRSSVKNRLENRRRLFRQRLARRGVSPKDRLNNAMRAIGGHGRREVVREGRPVVRGETRRQVRRLISRYF
jgi:hypothetical protein